MSHLVLFLLRSVVTESHHPPALHIFKGLFCLLAGYYPVIPRQSCYLLGARQLTIWWAVPAGVEFGLAGGSGFKYPPPV